MSHERALEIIVGGDNRTRPGQFDPQLIDLLHDKGQVLAEIYDDSMALTVKTVTSAKNCCVWAKIRN
jgi:HD-GYP domain-containing protein (c-di-GMP phosphodiesterase class II)